VVAGSAQGPRHDLANVRSLGVDPKFVYRGTARVFFAPLLGVIVILARERVLFVTARALRTGEETCGR